jgi:hypothetical protein
LDIFYCNLIYIFWKINYILMGVAEPLEREGVSIGALSGRALDTLVGQGIVGYVNSRSGGRIKSVVLYGSEPNTARIYELLSNEVINANVSIGNGVPPPREDLQEGLQLEDWHLDVDELIGLYAKGTANC